MSASSELTSEAIKSKINSALNDLVSNVFPSFLYVKSVPKDQANLTVKESFNKKAPKQKKELINLLKNVLEALAEAKENGYKLDNKELKVRINNILFQQDLERVSGCMNFTIITPGIPEDHHKDTFRLEGHDNLLTLGDLVNTLIPKVILLIDFDLEVEKLEKKIKELEKRAKKESSHNGDYTKAHQAAKEIKNACTTARDLLIKSASLKTGLTAMNAHLNGENVNQSLRELANHRRPIANSFVSTVYNLTGYVLYALTYPGRCIDKQGVESYVNSWFEPRQTNSYGLFSSFRNKANTLQLPEEIVADEQEHLSLNNQ